MEINNTDFNILLDNNKVIMSPKILYSDVIAINNLRDGYTRTKGNKSPNEANYVGVSFYQDTPHELL
jgi:hypothetical protein